MAQAQDGPAADGADPADGADGLDGLDGLDGAQAPREGARLRVLLVAYACEPGRGGEGEIAWSLACGLGERHDVTVLTRANAAGALRAGLAGRGGPPPFRVAPFDLPRALVALKGRGGKAFLPYYYAWQLAAGREVRRLERSQGFDLVHHLTGGMDWMPSAGAFARAPFVWGPVGSEDTHPAVLAGLPAASRWRDRLRRALRATLRHADPFVRLTRRRARVILSHNPRALPGVAADRVRPFVQTGIDAGGRLAATKATLARGDRLRVLHVGELVDWKGCLFALDAFARFHATHPASSLAIVGSGPLEAELRARIARLGLADAVRLAGRLPMDRVVAELAQADVFLYPSFHHGLATIVLQAMLTGLPVVCLEGDAIGRTVGQTAGITVPAAPGHSIPDRLADALRLLATHEPLRQAKAHAAITLAQTRHAYPALVKHHSRIYAHITHPKST